MLGAVEMPDEDEGMSHASRSAGSEWHLQKSFSVGILFSVVSWVLWGVWFASSNVAAINSLESRTAHLEAHDERTQRVSSQIAVTVAKIDGEVGILLERQQQNAPAAPARH